MFDVIIEITRAIIVCMILVYLRKVGGKEDIRQQDGWLYILIGFGLLLFGTLIDITDNFPNLDRYIIIGDTKYQAMLEKVVGNLLGLIFLFTGLWKWMPTIVRHRKAQRELIKAKAIADRANRVKSEFLANMSHELRTPLNHIIGFTELVLDSNLGKLNDTQKGYLTDVCDSGKHLLSIVNDLLDLANIEAGRQKIDLSEVNLRELLKNSMVVVEDIAAKHRIQLSLDMDGVPEVIKSDRRVLKQTMHNLLSNALKFTEDQGLVTISATMVDCYTRPGRRRGDPESFQVILDPMSNERESGATYQKCVEIAVSDTGIGIRSEDHDRIFNRLEQVDCTLQKKYQGTGLGLALTKSQVELAGGKIWVESDGKDKGSIFRFIIPT